MVRVNSVGELCENVRAEKTGAKAKRTKNPKKKFDLTETKKKTIKNKTYFNYYGRSAKLFSL